MKVVYLVVEFELCRIFCRP